MQMKTILAELNMEQFRRVPLYECYMADEITEEQYHTEVLDYEEAHRKLNEQLTSIMENTMVWERALSLRNPWIQQMEQYKTPEALLCIGVLMLIYGSGREAKGFGKVTAVFGAVYNGLTGWFGDILSYSRLMALMLAGSVIAQVFNTLAAMPSSGGVTVVSMIVFIIIFLLGHLLNFGLNLLGCFVHDLRLQCLEFFGKFYVDGGKPFRPLEINTRYVDVENHNF